MKTKLIILFALSTLSMMTFAQTKDTAQIQNAKNYMYKWKLGIDFKLPALSPEAIQIALVDFDPTEKFMQKFNMIYLTEKLKKAKDDEERTFQIIIGITVYWNNLFDVVKGSELYLLTPNPFILSSVANYSKPITKKWLVSKSFLLDNKPYCYIIPIELENGTNLDITLDTTNLISLTDIYNKIKK